MATVTFHVFPAIGIARVGDSESDYYIAPEATGEPVPPAGGFRDKAGKLKPQAARFGVWARVVADGVIGWHQITVEHGDFNWNVVVANTKTTNPVFGVAPNPLRNTYLQGKYPGKLALGATTTPGKVDLAAKLPVMDLPAQAVQGTATFAAPLHGKQVETSPLHLAALKVTYSLNTFQSENAFKNTAVSLAAAGAYASGPGQEIAVLTLHLASAKLEASGKLLVIGGRGRCLPAWSTIPSLPLLFDNFLCADEVGDGPVTVALTLNAVGAAMLGLQAGSFPVAPAWVVVAPPSFSRIVPPLVSGIDLIENRLATMNVLLADVPSFARDIAPILNAAYESCWATIAAFSAPGHSKYLAPTALKDLNYLGPDPAIAALARKGRAHVVAVLRKPSSESGSLPTAIQNKFADVIAEMNALNETKKMPPVAPGFPPPTMLQYVRLLKWVRGDFTPGVEIGSPPEELDRASLGWIVGAALGPGIEVGIDLSTVGLNAVQEFGADLAWTKVPWDRFRLDPATPPGTLTRGLALPWHTDFQACVSWLSARPVNVFLPLVPNPGEVQLSTNQSFLWNRGATSSNAMVNHWSELGLLRRAPDGAVYETERILPEPGSNVPGVVANLDSAGVDFGVVHAGAFDGERVRAYAARPIVLTASPGVTAAGSNLEFIGPAGTFQTAAGWVLKNTTQFQLMPMQLGLGALGTLQQMQIVQNSLSLDLGANSLCLPDVN